MKAKTALAALLALFIFTACHRETDGEKVIRLFNEYTEKVEKAQSREQLDNILDQFHNKAQELDAQTPTLTQEEQEKVIEAMNKFYKVSMSKRMELSDKELEKLKTVDKTEIKVTDPEDI